MKAISLALTTSGFALFVMACSGTKSAPIPDGGTSTGTDPGGRTGGDAGDVVCGPCESPPPLPGCRGQGACGCAPYDCSGTGGSDCVWSKDQNTCDDGMYCLTTSCGRGTCVPVGAAEKTNRDPFCGCDGVTYWNESVATRNGVSVRRKGACAGGDAISCQGGDCPGDAICNLRVGSKAECDAPLRPGTCWRTPNTCDAPVASAARIRSCQTGSCGDECAAIQENAPWYEDPLCRP